jgi:hypothetical protein
MKGLKLRPRTKYISNLSVSQVMDSFLNKLKKPSEDIYGSILEHHVYLKINKNKQHYWSPELHITVEENKKGSLIRGVAGPNPKIWTMFMFFYSTIIVLFILGGSLGLSQWSLGINAPWLWSIPASAIAWLVILGAAKYGQHKGNDQLILLNTYMYEAIAEGEERQAKSHF